MLFDEITSCSKCSLRANCAIEPSLPISNLSPIMIIVEKPDDSASIVREPINSSDWMFFRKAGLEKAYITSILKCPGKTSKLSIEACFSYLEREIAFIKPKVILAFGGKASEILNKRGIAHKSFNSVHKILCGSKTQYDSIVQEIKGFL